MQNQIRMEDLIGQVLGRLAEMNYSEQTAAGYRRSFITLRKFAESRGKVVFDERIALEFIEWKFGEKYDSVFEARHVDNHYVVHFLRCCRILIEYQQSGTICKRARGDLQSTKLPIGLQSALESFNTDCRCRGLSESTVYSRGNRIKHFLLWEEERGVLECSDIGANDAADYVVSKSSLHAKTVQCLLTTLRCFLRHLYLEGITEEDLSLTVPTPKRYYAPSLPAVWTEDDLTKLFSGIDRGNPAGKRDYAMLLIIARLGLRSSDVRQLRLGDIRWKDKAISIVQHKTKVSLELPLLDDVGWALIDYLKHGRPESADDHVFLRMLAPFEPFENTSGLNSILARRAQQAGVKSDAGAKTVHSLRHALASRLLKQEVPLDDIMRIMGHVNRKTTGIYLHMDDESLARCALDPEAVVT